MPRFFVDLPLAVQQSVVLPEPAARHAALALRLQKDDAVTLFNGSGGEYRGRLLESSAKRCIVELDLFLPREAELPYALTLAQGLSGGDKMDWTIEKSVELGVFAVQPLALERSLLRLTDQRLARRQAHWQGISQAAAEQCGRNQVPPVLPVLGLATWLAKLPEDALRLAALPAAKRAIVDVQAAPLGRPVLFVVGPEGGFSANEERQLEDAGFLAVSLGPRILRTETAAPAALAMLSAVWSKHCRLNAGSLSEGNPDIPPTEPNPEN